MTTTDTIPTSDFIRDIYGQSEIDVTVRLESFRQVCCMR